MKVLVTGGGGQLGRALAASVPRDVEFVVTDRRTLDLSEPTAISRFVAAVRPECVVNAAAYTAVDRAETERDAAGAVNARAPAAFADACARIGATLVQVSTDFVFDGSRSSPYLPEDVPNPLNVYGRTKLDGERAVTGTPGLRWFVLRTAWVHSASGRNFVATILRLLRERRSASVVADQVGSPTSAASLANALWRVVFDRGDSAVLHFTDAGVASWYDFAVAIGEEATAAGILEPGWSVTPIPTSGFPTPARRPAYSVLDKSSTWSRLGIEPAHWRSALREVLREMSA